MWRGRSVRRVVHLIIVGSLLVLALIALCCIRFGPACLSQCARGMHNLGEARMKSMKSPRQRMGPAPRQVAWRGSVEKILSYSTQTTCTITFLILPTFLLGWRRLHKLVLLVHRGTRCPRETGVFSGSRTSSRPRATSEISLVDRIRYSSTRRRRWSPEPSTALLLGLGLTALAVRRGE